MKKMLKTVLFVVTAIFSTAIFAETDACDKPASLNTRTVDDVTYYEIGSCGDLYKFAEMVNGGETAINGMLIDDIVVNEGVLNADGTLSVDSAKFIQWIPMGTIGETEGTIMDGVYVGMFDGQGHVISGLYLPIDDLIDGQGDFDYVGFFGVVGKNAKIENVGVVDSYISGNQYVGGVIGYILEGTVNAVHFSGLVRGVFGVGGVVGACAMCDISNSYNASSVAGLEIVGGVAGWSGRGSIRNSFNMGSIVGEESTGGVIGSNDGGELNNVYNAGSVNVDAYVGGIAGENYGIISNTYNVGVVRGKQKVGGVIGYNSGEAYNCYFSEDTYGGVAVGVVDEASVAENVSGMLTMKMANELPMGFNGGEGISDIWIAGSIVHGEHAITINVPILSTIDAQSQPNFVLQLEKASDEKDYFLIDNAMELRLFAQFVNGGETSINGKLTADICLNACGEGESVLKADGTLNEDDASKFVKWIPIGTDVNSFAGTFDGDGHTIRGLYFNDASVKDVGLFGKVLAATIQNVGLEDLYINGGSCVGALAGTIASGSKVSDVYNAGSVSGKKNIGGVIGKVDSSEVNDAYNVGVVATEEYSAGGVAGDVVKSTIANVYNTGDVSGPEWIGGVVGSGSGSTISQVYNAGEINGSLAVGGLVGTFTSKSSLRNAYNIGKVSGDDRVGGVFGYVYEGAIVYVYSKGEVIAEENGGGLIGFFDSGTIDSSYFDEAIYAGEAVGINKYGLGITGTEVLGKTSAELIAGTSLKLDTAVWVLGGVGVGTTNDTLYYPYLKVFGPHEYVLSDVKKYSISVAVNDETMGIVTGAGEYEYGAKVEISATAKKGYKFVKWSDGVKDAKRTITVTKAEKLTATFEKDSKKDAVVAMAQLPQFSVTASGKMVSIAGARPNTSVVVYDLQGNRVKTVVAPTANFTFALPSAGVYIVKNGYTAKRVNVR